METVLVEVESPLQPEVASLLAQSDAVVERGDGTVEVKRMIVDQGTRGRGVGAALLWNAHAQARRLGAHTALLEVGVRNTEAQALYWRAGYRPCEPFPPYEQSPISLFMELRL
jgi:putative acetyltransferase